MAEGFLATGASTGSGGDPCAIHVHTGPDTRFRGNVVALTARNRQAGLTIGPQTPIPDWLGEGMDDSMAVEGLLKRE